ncbi:MAG TPA: signal peptide peptidase SppA [Candidatus Cloacimonadota bacterium]|nr:signal peptide peptidase SppA [Candidatus Cloacimonadota bacterium]HPS38201.1 signal peptide peptidase SppA [Candidatus Cloacimonadota bacterium]
MNTNTKILTGCLVVPVVLIVAFCIGFCSTMGKATGVQTVSKNSWLVINSSGMIPAYNELEYNEMFGMDQPSVPEICQRIRAAADDSRIKGLYLEPGIIEVSYSGLSEISLAIQDFRKSKKPVIAFGDMLSQKDYFLCLSADKVYMNPSASAGLMLEGVSANIMFYKEMLDKLGIRMHVLQSGAYKGAGEPYSQTQLTPGTQENLNAVLKARYDLLLKAVQDCRKLTSAEVQAVFETRPDYFISGKTALEYKLIDGVMSRDDLMAQYKITKENKVSISKYHPSLPSTSGPTRIAVVNLNGNISMDSGYSSEGVISSKKVQSILDAIEKDETIKAVVLRVNSPGGSALESELIYQKLTRLKKRMPIVVSMNGVAASGGYYISCASDYIMADEMTITGSIGVIMMLPGTEGLGRKLGLRNQTLGYGKYAGKLSLFNDIDPEMLDSMRRNSTAVYDEFKARVMSARGISADKIGDVAEGRVFSASAAKANGLIDEVGGLDKAIAKAAALAKVKDYKTVDYPSKISFFELIMKTKSFPRLMSSLTRSHQLEPADLEEYLLKTLQPGEWLYYLPYKMD